MKARIRSGAIIGQDHRVREFHKEEQGLIFDVHPFSETRMKLTAPGYGESGAYGHGALYVAKEDVMPVDEPLKVDPYEDSEEIRLGGTVELAEEIYRAYAYFSHRSLPPEAGEPSEIAASQRSEMFQAWLAVKLALARSPAMQAGSDSPKPDVGRPWVSPHGDTIIHSPETT